MENGIIRFIGEPEKRIKEDFLRILRYLRFYHGYSSQSHEIKTSKLIKKNIIGVSNLSKERLLDELKKFIKSNLLTKLSKDKFSIELFEIIFPQIKNIKLFYKNNDFAKLKIKESDFIFLLSILIIDQSDNSDYFFYKFNISKNDQKRIKIIDEFYNEKITNKSFSEKNLNKIFFYFGKQAVIDILSYRLFISQKVEIKLVNLIDHFKSKILPSIPISAEILMKKYNIPAGKNLGDKLKALEEEWVKNDFKLSDKQINKIIGL